MSTIGARIVGGLRALFAKARVEQELDDELRAYVDAAVEQKVAAGMTREHAVRAARAEMGSLEAIKDYTRDAGWESIVESIWQDVRYAVRSFRRTPAFTTAAIATLALGIGGTTAIFSVVDALFLRAPEGVAEPSSLRKVFIVRDEGGILSPEGGRGSWVDYVAMRDSVPAFSGIGAHGGAALANLGRGPEAEQVRASVVSHEFLDVLGVRPALGRFFRPEDDGAQGSSPVAVVSYGMWQRRFGGATDVIGRTILLNGDLLEIVGVTPRGFTGIGADAVDVWVPSSVPRNDMAFADDWRTHPGSASIMYVARLAPGVTESLAIEQAATALRHAAASAPMLDPTPGVVTTSIALAATPSRTATGNLSLWLALAAAVVLIIACANVANLMLARGLTRRRELTVRLAVGGSRWRLARQQLTESAVLALAGGAAGVVFAYWTMGLLRQFPVPPSAGTIDARLLIFALVVSIATGVLFGVLPAVRAAKADPVHGLREARAAGRSSHSRTRKVLVTVQVSLSLALLVGAALFVRSLREVTAIDTGVDLDRLLTARVDLRGASIDREAFYELALSRLSTLPGIEDAAIVHLEPFSGATSISWRMAGRTSPEGRDLQGAFVNVVGPGYFRTAGTRLLRGREFDGTEHGEPVAVVNEALARLMADDGNAVGACVSFGSQVEGGGCTRIVGVVETQRNRYLEPPDRPLVFLSWTQAPDAITFGIPALLIRTHGEPSAQLAAVRSALQGLRSDLPTSPSSRWQRTSVTTFCRSGWEPCCSACSVCWRSPSQVSACTGSSDISSASGRRR